MAITIPNAFSAGTTILSSQVNENFDEIAEKALDKTGDTITGNLTVSPGVTIDGVDVGALLDQAVKTTSSPTFDDLTVSGTLTVAGYGFPAVQVPSADANTLDDYEEGTYVPTWTSAGVAPVLGDGTIAGAYIKVGKEVTVHIKLAMGSTTTYGNAANGWTLSLPFTALNGDTRFLGPVLMTDAAAGFFTGVGYIEPNEAVARISPTSAGTTVMPGIVASNNPHNWANGDRLDLTITYTADA